MQDNQKLTLDDVKKLWSNENHDINSRLISLKYKIVMVLIFFTIICMSLLHLSANLQGLRETYSDQSIKWDNIIYVTFFFGINHNEQSGGDSYLYEMYGFIIILALCILERKSQIWLTNRFGYIGSKYDIQDFKFVLQNKETKNNRLKRNSTQNSKAKEISFEIQDRKSEKDNILYVDSQDLNEASVNHTKYDLVDDNKYKDTEEKLQKEFDIEKTNRIKDVIKLNVFVRICKGFRVFLYTIIILLTMLAAIKKSNLFSIIMMIAVIFMTFGKLTYFNLKWFSLFIMLSLFIQYLSALANLSPWNSPSAIPIPFNNITMKSPIGVPFYKELKKPFTKYETQETDIRNTIPTKWSFYIGMLISSSRLEYLWFDWIVIILLYYFFVYFNSYTFEKDVEPVTDDNIHKILVTIEDQEEDEMIEKINQSFEINYNIQEKDSSSIIIEPSRRRNSSLNKQSNTHKKEIKKKMLLYKLYGAISTGVSATSTIISLV